MGLGRRVRIQRMRVLTGRVVDGKVELGGEIEDGTPVAVLAPDREGSRLTAAEEAELSEALDEIQRGEFEDGFALLREIKAQAGR
jgi:hypothetical protein